MPFWLLGRIFEVIALYGVIMLLAFRRLSKELEVRWVVLLLTSIKLLEAKGRFERGLEVIMIQLPNSITRGLFLLFLQPFTIMI